jgi:hypothetical protein
LGQSIVVVSCAGSALLLTPVVRPATSQLATLISPTSRLNFGFVLRENLLMCSSHIPLGVSQLLPQQHSARLSGAITEAPPVTNLNYTVRIKVSSDEEIEKT